MGVRIAGRIEPVFAARGGVWPRVRRQRRRGGVFDGCQVRLRLLGLSAPICLGGSRLSPRHVKGYPGTRYAIYFVTRSTTAYAIDAHDGKLLWKTLVKDGLNNLSATAACYDGRLYVPMSGTETLTGANLDYECCKSRGAVVALNANTGKVLWRAQSIPEPLHVLGENSHGKQTWGPAGASVWNTPTVDAKRKLIYVGTGNSFGRIAASTSDSILALRMEDGKMVWHHQEFAGDSFMNGCRATNAADTNCPEKLGPDYDFGGSSAILQTVNGKDILVAAGKGGVAIGLDPDAEGKLVWRTQLWETQAPSASGLSGLGRRGGRAARLLSVAAARRRIESAATHDR